MGPRLYYQLPVPASDFIEADVYGARHSDIADDHNPIPLLSDGFRRCGFWFGYERPDISRRVDSILIRLPFIWFTYQCILAIRLSPTNSQLDCILNKLASYAQASGLWHIPGYRCSYRTSAWCNANPRDRDILAGQGLSKAIYVIQASWNAIKSANQCARYGSRQRLYLHSERGLASPASSLFQQIDEQVLWARHSQL